MCDVKWGEWLMVFVVGKLGVCLKVEVICDCLLVYVDVKCISKYVVLELDCIVFVVEIFKMSVGKINKKVLCENVV